MMKGFLKFILLTFLISSTIAVNADTKRVQQMEGELWVGMTTPLGEYHRGNARLMTAFGLEGRYNFHNTPWDCGVMLELTTARRSYSKYFHEDGDLWQNNRTLGFLVMGDYNFHQGRKVNPFAGIGIGIAHNDVVGDKFFPAGGTTFLFSPRAGVEFFHHIRLTAQFNVSRKGYNNFSLNLGFVVGGRPKK